jgi:heme ABC exporter ATP-binding subunit CcmA
MIKVVNLVKAFGTQTALRGINLNVAEGEFLTIFGPNGAGKTTLIRILAGISRPSAGRVLLDGLELTPAWAEARRHIGLVSHHSYLYPDLTAEENLIFYGRMYDVPNLTARIHEMLESVGLLRRLHDPVRTFSRGMQQRLSIARALLHDPLLLLLDEPYTGLDQAASDRLRDVLGEAAHTGRTVLMTTHNLERGLALCDRAVIVSNGRVVFESDRQTLSEKQWRETYHKHVGTTP